MARLTAGNTVSITVTDGGFQPATVTILAGQSVHWTNASSRAQSVTADAGVFDSGLFAPTAGYTVAPGMPSVYTYYSTANPSLRGTVRVALDALAGGAADPASAHIPDLPFFPADPGDVSLHPRLAVMASRTHILLGFAADTTVAQANAALAGTGVVIIGGLPRLGLLLVEAPDTPDFSGLTATLTALRANPAVDVAAMSMQGGDARAAPGRRGLRAHHLQLALGERPGGHDADAQGQLGPGRFLAFPRRGTSWRTSSARTRR